MPEYEVERVNTEIGAGFKIREKIDPPGSGFIVTDGWLKAFGFGIPSFLNIDSIINAMWACYAGSVRDEKAQGRAVLETPEMTRSRFYT